MSPTAEESPHPKLTPPSEGRIPSLDLLRGIAVLGILLMNGQAFSMPFAAYFNPYAYGGEDWLNVALHGSLHLLADQKCMALFSMLFGASTLLVIDSRRRSGQSVARFHYTRNFWLLIAGLSHGILLWNGDILAIYAFCAFGLYFFRNLPPRWMCLLGGASFFTPMLFQLWIDESTFVGIPDFQDFWNANGARLQASLAVHRAEYSVQIAARLGDYSTTGKPLPELALAVALFDLPFRAFGMMLFGMALFRSGVLSAARSPRFYRRCIVWGLGVGLSCSGFGLALNHLNNWNAGWVLGTGRVFNLVATPCVALGYVGLVMRWSQVSRFEALKKSLAAVGRMSLTNYIVESLLGAIVFTGVGFGRFGTVNRIELLGFTILVWFFLLILSKQWMSRFRYGPLEWVWRSLCYLRLEPLRVAQGDRGAMSRAP